MMSAMGAVDDRVAGLRAGGDDYLAKPFAMSEFSARVDALARRFGDTAVTVLIAGPLSMDLLARKVRRRGREIELLPREFKLLEYFMRRPGQVINRQMLLEDVWNYRFQAQSNVVDVHIRNLRINSTDLARKSSSSTCVAKGSCSMPRRDLFRSTPLRLAGVFALAMCC